MQPNYHVCPTTKIDVVNLGERERVARFNAVGTDTGLVEKPLKEFRLATFNARAETIAEKPMFRALIQEPTLPHSNVRLLRVKGHSAGKTALLFLAL